MTSLLNTVPAETLRTFMFERLQNCSEQETKTLLSSFLRILDDKLLAEVSGFSTLEDAKLEFRVEGLTKEKVLSSNFAKERQALYKEFLVEFKYVFHKTLETLITLIGLNEVIRQKQNKYTEKKEILSPSEAQAKLDIYSKLIAFPVGIYALVHSSLQLKKVSVALTAVSMIAWIVALVAYNRYWKPCPIDHYGMRNLTVEGLSDPIPSLPRRQILDQIEAAFKSGKGVILVGDPGVGKSQIVRALVQEMALKRICSFIQDAQVFFSNSSNLVTQDLIAGLETRFSKYKNNVVFFFDEFHTVFQENNLIGFTAGSELKTFCDEFKYVIGATTREEYTKHIEKKTAIAGRRFEVIEVPPMSAEEMKAALSLYRQNASPASSFAPGIYDTIIDEARKSSSTTEAIDASMSLLKAAIERVNSVEQPELNDKKCELEREIGQLLEILIDLSDNKLSDGKQSLISELQEKEKELNKVTEEIEKRKSRTLRMQRLEGNFLRLKKECYTLADPVNTDKVWNTAAVRQQWLRSQALMSVLKEQIKRERVALDLPICLDKSVIDAIVLKKHSSK